MNNLEYHLSAAVLRVALVLFSWLPVRPQKVVFASARADRLEGNLAYVYAALADTRPHDEYVFLLETYSYGFWGKVRYLIGLLGGCYHLATARLFIVDNAYLPVHVRPHRAGTTVIQVWHAAGALKRFGVDIESPDRSVENRFVHKNYDYVIVGSQRSVAPYASALRTDPARVLPLGVARTDFFFDETAMARARDAVYAQLPGIEGTRVVLYAPTFRGYGAHKSSGSALDPSELRQKLPSGVTLVYKPHPVLDLRDLDTAGFDAVADRDVDINDLMCVADILVTDYSSSIFEYALLRKPLVLLVPDLCEYERDPGFYVEFRTEMIGERAETTADVARLISADTWDLDAYGPFLAEHCEACDGYAGHRFSEFVGRLLDPDHPTTLDTVAGRP
jgi:CDP-ribitol ribitolphosphotransferase